jgi:hypothetical protein
VTRTTSTWKKTIIHKGDESVETCSIHTSSLVKGKSCTEVKHIYRFNGVTIIRIGPHHRRRGNERMKEKEGKMKEDRGRRQEK